jgi:hypothetical protein
MEKLTMYERKDRNFYLKLNRQEVLQELLAISTELCGREAVNFDFDYIPRGAVSHNGIDRMIVGLSGKDRFRSGRSKTIDALNAFLDNEYDPAQHGIGFLYVAFDAVQKCVNQQDIWILDLPDTLGTCARLFKHLNSGDVQSQIAEMRGQTEYLHFMTHALHAFEKQLIEVKRIGKERHDYFSRHDSKATGKYEFDDTVNPFLSSYATFLSFIGRQISAEPHCDMRTQLFECEALSHAFNDMADPDLSYRVYEWDDLNEMSYEEFMIFIDEKSKLLMETYSKHYGLRDDEKDLRIYRDGDIEYDKGGQLHMDFGRDEEARLSYCDHYPHLARMLKL